jgi:hypothetical protein
MGLCLPSSPWLVGRRFILTYSIMSSLDYHFQRSVREFVGSVSFGKKILLKEKQDAIEARCKAPKRFPSSISYFNKEYSCYRIEADNISYDGDIAIIRPDSDVGTSQNTDSHGIKYYFINGIKNTLNSSRDLGKSIAEFLNNPVYHIYSETLGASNDILLAHDFLDGKMTVASIVFSQHLKKDIQKKQKVIILAHSRGAALVKGVIESHAFKDLDLSRVQLITLGAYDGRRRWAPRIKKQDIVNEIDLGFMKLSDPIHSLPSTTTLGLPERSMNTFVRKRLGIHYSLLPFEIAFLHPTMKYIEDAMPNGLEKALQKARNQLKAIK